MDLKLIEQAEEKLGVGRFQVSSLIQKRAQEIVRGASPLVDTRAESPIEVALAEILDGRVTLDLYDGTAEGSQLEEGLDISDESLDDDSGLDF